MALLGIALFVALLITETGTALLIVFCLAIGGVAMKLEENPPRWLLRSPLGRWLRR